MTHMHATCGHEQGPHPPARRSRSLRAPRLVWVLDERLARLVGIHDYKARTLLLSDPSIHRSRSSAQRTADAGHTRKRNRLALAPHLGSRWQPLSGSHAHADACPPAYHAAPSPDAGLSGASGLSGSGCTGRASTGGAPLPDSGAPPSPRSSTKSRCTPHCEYALTGTLSSAEKSISSNSRVSLPWYGSSPTSGSEPAAPRLEKVPGCRHAARSAFVAGPHPHHSLASLCSEDLGQSAPGGQGSELWHHQGGTFDRLERA